MLRGYRLCYYRAGCSVDGAFGYNKVLGSYAAVGHSMAAIAIYGALMACYSDCTVIGHYTGVIDTEFVTQPTLAI